MGTDSYGTHILLDLTGCSRGTGPSGFLEKDPAARLQEDNLLAIAQCFVEQPRN